MDRDDPFSRELRSARDRIAELRRRSGASQRYGGLLPEATLAFLRAQEHAMKGPCVHALLLERPVQAAGLADDPRWPQLAEAYASVLAALLELAA
jgi:hypothetical protein